MNDVVEQRDPVEAFIRSLDPLLRDHAKMHALMFQRHGGEILVAYDRIINRIVITFALSLPPHGCEGDIGMPRHQG